MMFNYVRYMTQHMFEKFKTECVAIQPLIDKTIEAYVQINQRERQYGTS